MDAAKERKARLKALKEDAAVEAGADAQPTAAEPEAGAQKSGAGIGPTTQTKAAEPKTDAQPKSSAQPALKFRNYTVRDKDRREHTNIAPATAPEFKLAEPEIRPSSKEDLLANVAPKKPNHDLRRDVEKQLAKLERRTQRALVKIAQSQEVLS